MSNYITINSHNIYKHMFGQSNKSRTSRFYAKTQPSHPPETSVNYKITFHNYLLNTPCTHVSSQLSIQSNIKITKPHSPPPPPTSPSPIPNYPTN